MKNKTRLFWLVAIFAVIAVGFVSCGNGDDDYIPFTPPQLPPGNNNNNNNNDDNDDPPIDLPRINFTEAEQVGGVSYVSPTTGIHLFFEGSTAGTGLTAAHIFLTERASRDGAQLQFVSTTAGIYKYLLAPITVSAPGPIDVVIAHERFTIFARPAMVHMATLPTPDYFVINWQLGSYTGVAWAVGGEPSTSKRRNDSIPPFPNPTRPGHTFAGWFTDNTFLTPLPLPTAAVSDLRPYAGWVGITLTHNDTPTYTPRGPHTFPVLPIGYVAATHFPLLTVPLTVRVINTGNIATGAISLDPIVGFEVPGGLPPAITGGLAPGAAAETFIIQPVDSLAGGIHTGTVTLRGATGNVTSSFSVTVNVDHSVIDITLPAFSAVSAVNTAINNAFNPAMGNHSEVRVISSAPRTTIGTFTVAPAAAQFTADRTLIWEADLTVPSGNIITHAGAGTLHIRNGRLVSAGTGIAINATGSGTVRISGTSQIITANATAATGGTIVLAAAGGSGDRLIMEDGLVENTATGVGGRAINNLSEGYVRIRGGTVRADAGMAIRNAVSGNVRISQAVSSVSTSITSANITAAAGTIVLEAAGAAGDRLIMEGGNVANTSNNPNSRVINNLSAGNVTITGGEVWAWEPGTSGVGVPIRNAGAGTITLGGGSDPALPDIYSATDAAGTGTIALEGAGNFVMRSGRVWNSAGVSTARAINNLSTGSVTISGGEVMADDEGVAIRNASTGHIIITPDDGSPLITSANVTDVAGTIVLENFGAGGQRLTMTGGEVRNTAVSGRTINNQSTGYVTINAGTVNAGNGVAIWNARTGIINIGHLNGNRANIRSASANGNEGTIVLADEGGAVIRLNMTGGLVENTANVPDGRAINNLSNGIINISGGTVQANRGIAIRNDNTGLINISQASIISPTYISSSNQDFGAGTIYLRNVSPLVHRLNVSGGTIRNVALIGPRWAIWSACGTTSQMNLTGGIIGDTSPPTP